MSKPKDLTKKILVSLLTVLMVFSSVPTAVFAEDGVDVTTTSVPTTETPVVEGVNKNETPEVNETPVEVGTTTDNQQETFSNVESNEQETLPDLNFDYTGNDTQLDAPIEEQNQDGEDVFVWSVGKEDSAMFKELIEPFDASLFSMEDAIIKYSKAETLLTLYAMLLNNNISNYADFIDREIIDYAQFDFYYSLEEENNIFRTLESNIEFVLSGKSYEDLSQEEIDFAFYLIDLENKVLNYLTQNSHFNENGNLIFEETPDEDVSNFRYITDENIVATANEILLNTFIAQGPYGDLTSEAASNVACRCSQSPNHNVGGSTGNIEITYTHSGNDNKIIVGNANCTVTQSGYPYTVWSCSSSIGTFTVRSDTRGFTVDGVGGVSPVCIPMCYPCNETYASKCAHGFWYKTNATLELGAPVISGGTYFCIEPPADITSCCTYSGLQDVRNLSQEEALRLAILFQTHPEGGVEVAKCVWNILRLGKGSVPACAYETDPDKVNSTSVQTHTLSLSPNPLKLNYKVQNEDWGYVNDGEHNLGRNYWENTGASGYKFDLGYVHSGLSVSIERSSHRTYNKILTPYPLSKQVCIDAGEEERRGELAGGGSVQGVTSEGCQDFLHTGQFQAGSLKIDRFQGACYNVVQKYGRLQLSKYDERTGSTITSAVRDQLGHQVSKDFRFKIFIDCTKGADNNYLPTSSLFCGLDGIDGGSISAEDRTGNYPEGKDLHYMRIPSSDSESTGRDMRNSPYSLDDNGILSVNFIPFGKYYIKETATHADAYELNPNYYEFTINSDSVPAGIVHVAKSDSTELNNGNETPNFPNMQYAIVTLNKDMAASDDFNGGDLHPTSTDKDAAPYQRTYNTAAKFSLYIAEPSADDPSPLWNSVWDTKNEITVNGVKYHQIKTTDNKTEWTTDENGNIQAQYVVIPRMPDGKKVYSKVTVYWREMNVNRRLIKRDVKLYKVEAEPNKTKGIVPAQNEKIVNNWYGSAELHKWTVKGTGQNLAVEEAKNLVSTMSDTYNNSYSNQKSTFWIYIDSDSPLWNNRNTTLGNSWNDDKIFYPYNYDIGETVRALMEDGTTRELHRIQLPKDDTDDIVKEWVTDANGYLVIKYLPEGRYYIKENETAYPYKEDEVFHEFDIQLNKRTLIQSSSQYMVEKNQSEIAARFPNDRYGVLEIMKWSRQMIADCGLPAPQPAIMKDTYTDEYGYTYNTINEYAVYVDEEQMNYIKHVESLSNEAWSTNNFRVGNDISGTIKTKFNKEYDNNIQEDFEVVKKMIPAADNNTGKDLYLVQVLKHDTNYSTDGVTWRTINGYSVIKYLPKGNYYLKEISTNEDIFELNPNYEPFVIDHNETTQMMNDSVANREYNNRLGILYLTKWDEDSDNDLPRKITKTYCEMGGEDDAYCDEINQWDTVETTGQKVDQLDNLFVLLSKDPKILNYRSGMYDNGPYAAVDEDGEFIGFVTGTNEEGEPILTEDPNDPEVLHSIIIPDTRVYGDYTYHAPGPYPKMVQYDVDINKDETISSDEKFDFQAWRTNDEGIILFKYLPAGEYYVKEHSTDIEIFTLDEAFYKYNVEHNRTQSLTSTLSKEKGEDMIAEGQEKGDADLVANGETTKSCRFLNAPAVKTGGLEFVKLDDEGHNAGAGHVFEIWYINNTLESKKAALAINPETGREYNPGKKDISHSYEVARTKTAKKRYLLGYYPDKFIDPDNVQFQINVHKDKSDYREDGTYAGKYVGKYVYKGNGESISQFITDENGRIYIERLPIGTYIIKEVETRDDVYDLTLDNYDNEFYVRDDQGKVYNNAYMFTVDYKMVTCLNGFTNPSSRATENSACAYTTESTYVKNNKPLQVGDKSYEVKVYKNTKGIFLDEESKNNQTRVHEHNAEVQTTLSFLSKLSNEATLNSRKTYKGIANEWSIEKGSFELIKRDEFGNSSSYHDVADKIFELYYLDDNQGNQNEVFSKRDGSWFIAEGSYTIDQLTEFYAIPDDIKARLSVYGDRDRAAALAIQVDDINKTGKYEFKHWNSNTVDFDYGEINDSVSLFSTGTDGKVVIDQMPVGDYLVVEVGTTNAFILNNQGDNMANVEDGATTLIEIDNYYRNVDIELSKVSGNMIKIPLDDAKFVVYDVTPSYRTDYENVRNDEVLFVRVGSQVDLYDLLIAGREIENGPNGVNGRAVKYSLNNAKNASVDTNGILTASQTGKVTVQVLGGVHSLYGNIQNRTFYTGTDVRNYTSDVNNIKLFATQVFEARTNSYVVTDEGVDVKFYKDAAKTQPLDILSYEISYEDGYDINTPGTYTLTHYILTTDHVIYTFTSTIEFVERDSSVCTYYPSAGEWLQEGRICDNDRQPYYGGPEVTYNKETVMRLVNAADDSSWNNKKIGEPYDIYVISANELADRFVVDGSGNPVNAKTVKGTKVFEGITGHITIQLQDSENHNYPTAQVISKGLDTYTGPECTDAQFYKHYEANENGMVDLTEDAGKIDKLYFKSTVNQDGYYLAQSNVVEIDMTAPKEGWLLLKNLKHSREYIVCETEVPNGYDFSTNDNACRYYSTSDNQASARLNWGIDVRSGSNVRNIYRNSDINILNAWKANFDATDENKDTLYYTNQPLTIYTEDNQDRMIAEDKNGIVSLKVSDNTNEAHVTSLMNDSTGTKVRFEKYGESFVEGEIPEAFDNAVFDIWEVFNDSRKYANTLYEHYSEADRVAGKYLTLKNEDGSEASPRKYIGRYVGRFSSGSVYHKFLDDEGLPIVGAKVLISRHEDMSTIIAEGVTDENGVINVGGLGNGIVYYQLERPLKPDYNPCYEVNGQTYCDRIPTASDYIPLADLPTAYKDTHELSLSHGMFTTSMMDSSSVLVVEELAAINTSLGKYAVPDSEIAYIVDLAYSGFNFDQEFFHAEITNYINRHKMGTVLKEEGTDSKIIVADDEPYTLVDEVNLEGLYPNTNYVLRGKLINKATGQVYVDANGQEAVAEVEFTSPGSDSSKPDVSMSVNVEFNILPSNLEEDTELVAFEELWNVRGRNSSVIDQHKDLADVGQTVKVVKPSVRTTALETEFEDKVLEVKLYEGEKIQISDIVVAEGLRVGRNYKVCGYIHNKKTGEDLAAPSGLRYEACSEVFTADSDTMTITVPFFLDTAVLDEDGLEIVIFEDLLKVSDGFEKEIAEHKNPEDENQTLKVEKLTPTMGTTASNAANGEKVLSVYEYDEDILEIKDVIKGQNVKGNRTYVLYGWLMNKETNEPADTNPDGSIVKFRKEFTTPVDKNIVDFEEEMKLEISSEKVLKDNLELVVYEELYVLVDGEEKFVMDHKVLTDEGQTVKIKVEKPELRTKALDAADSDKIIDIYAYDNDVFAVDDEIIITNIKPNRKYVARGTLYNKKTGEIVKRLDGSVAIGETIFETKESKDINVHVVIPFDTEMVNMEDGLSLVAFEEVMIIRETPEGTTEERFVEKHENPEDEDQTVVVKHILPELGTLAYDASGNEEDKVIDIYAYENDKYTVADKVSIKRIKPGVKYTLYGSLYNKKTGEMVKNLDGELAMGKTEFTATSENMDVVVNIEFDSDSVNMEDGLSLVAFERLVVNKEPAEGSEEPIKEIQIGEHENPEDEDQTVVIKHIIPEISTIAYDAGDNDKLFEKGELYKDNIVKAIDTVSVKNIRVGSKYVLTGYFVEQSTGKEVLTNGEVKLGRAEFIADATEMEIPVEILTPVGSYAADTVLVAFEKLYVVKEVETEEGTSKEELLIASHEDLEDKDQSVNVYEYPKEIKTTLAFEGDKKTADVGNNIKLHDVVEYKGLVVGKTYILKATVINKANDSVVTTGELEFKVDGETIKTEGKITVPLKEFNASGMYNVELVCYEELYEVRTDREDNYKILEHKDKNDQNQTVKFNPEPPTPSAPPTNTGFGDIMGYLVIMAFALLSSIIAVLYKKNQIRKI